MSAPQPEEPFVDTDVRSGLVDYIGRILEHATPDSLIAGGASDSATDFSVRPRNHDALKHRESVYKAGGPVTSIIDSRSLMTYGTGIEFDSEAVVTDDRGRTPDAYLEDIMGDRIDLFAIDAGIQAYYAGDAWPEIVETRNGDFSHLNLVDPTTVDPSWDEHGQFTAIDQVVIEDGRPHRQPLDMDDVFHFTHSNATGGPLGESLIERNMDEIERFANNQVQRANAIRLHGSPHYSISVGSEGQSIPDKLMRRVRNRFRSDQVDEETNWVHGGDIEVSELDSPGFEGMSDITDTDARMLAWVFNFPLEWTNFGSAGLGEGTPAMSRIVKFERQARAEQKRFKAMLRAVLETVIERYSTFPPDVDFSIRFGDVVSDQQAVADWLGTVGWAFHRDEVRELMDHQPWDDTQDKEAPPELAPDTQLDSGAEGGMDGGGGGLFSHHEPGDEAPDPLDDDADAKERYANGGRGTGNRSLLHGQADADALTQEELVWEEVYDKVLWADDGDERQLFAFDPEEVPDFVVDRLETAVAAGALFDDFDTISAASAQRLGDVLTDSLEKQHGWSINSLTDNLMDEVPELEDRQEAERIARTETHALVNDAREQGYEEQFDLDEERFAWIGPNDGRNSDVCPEIKASQPDEGLPLDELKELVQDTAREFDHTPREWTPHINCRHTYTRQV